MKDGNSDKQDVFLSYRTDVDSLILKYGSHETYLFVNGYSGKKENCAGLTTRNMCSLVKKFQMQ